MGDKDNARGFSKLIPTVTLTTGLNPTLDPKANRIDTSEGEFENFERFELDLSDPGWNTALDLTTHDDPTEVGRGLQMISSMMGETCTDGASRLGRTDIEVESDEDLINTDPTVYVERANQFPVSGASLMDFDWAIATSGFCLGYEANTMPNTVDTQTEDSDDEDDSGTPPYGSKDRSYFDVFPMMKFDTDGSIKF